MQVKKTGHILGYLWCGQTKQVGHGQSLEGWEGCGRCYRGRQTVPEWNRTDIERMPIRSHPWTDLSVSQLVVVASESLFLWDRVRKTDVYQFMVYFKPHHTVSVVPSGWPIQGHFQPCYTRGAVVFVCHKAGCLVLDGLQLTDLTWSLGAPGSGGVLQFRSH